MSKELNFHSGQDPQILASIPGKGTVLACGDTVPSDTTVGFAPGCLFIHTDGATEATIWYANVGTLASCNFDAMDLNITEAAYLSGVTLGTVSASKVVTVDSNKDVTGFRHVTTTGTFTSGSDATDKVAIKGFYMTPANVSVSVPSITDPDIAKVNVSVASAFSMAPAVGDAVIAIPQEALPTNCRLQGAWVSATDEIEITFGSEGGNVTGASKNFKFLVMDLT